MLLTTLRAMNSMTSEVIGHRALLGLGPKDRDAGLEVRRGQVGDQAPLEPAAQPLLERHDRLRWPVGRQHDLLAVLVDRVERVEELFLGPFLVRDELDVVDQEQVDPPVAGAEVVDLALLDRRDELVGELLARRVDDALARELGDHLVADGVHQVRLAEPHAAVQEERVVGVPRALGDRQARGVGEAVGRPDDEVGEGVARVEVGRPALAADPGRLDPDLLLRGGVRAASGSHGVRVGIGWALRRGPDDEFDLDAVADDPREGLADQRAVARLQPVLGEAVRDRDPEALVIDVDELGVAQPRLEVGRREGDLEFSQGGSPDLFCVHSSMGSCGSGGRLMGSVDQGRVSGPSFRAAQGLPFVAPVCDVSRGSWSGFGGSRVRLRRRGPGEDSTARTGAARRFCNTPGSIGAWRRRSGGAPLARGSALPGTRFDTFLRAGLSSAGRRRAVRFRAPGAFACLQG